jgi:hypothetical protein
MKVFEGAVGTSRPSALLPQQRTLPSSVIAHAAA